MVEEWFVNLTNPRPSSGMKDKNGKVIRLGDKVKCTFKGSFIGRVVFHRGCFMVYGERQKKEKTQPYIRLSQWAERDGMTCEIIYKGK